MKSAQTNVYAKPSVKALARVFLQGLSWALPFSKVKWYKCRRFLIRPLMSIALVALLTRGESLVYAETYYSSGTLTSGNLLEGLGVSYINAFGYNLSTLPAGTTAQVQFSEDASTWYSSADVPGGWDALSQGDFTAEVNAIDLTDLEWTRNHFYYQVQFDTTDTGATATLDEAVVYYTAGPSVETDAPSDVDPVFTTANGEITALTEGNATLRGFEYGLTEEATWEVHEDGDFGAETYSLEVTGLSPNTTYYIRAYATNPESTGYGLWTSFITGAYATSGTLTSGNLLAGQTAVSISQVNYTLSSKPAGSTATIQFSQNGTNWYNAEGVLDGTSDLVQGNFAFSLCALMWEGDAFYYRLALTRGTAGDTPVLDEIKLGADDSEGACGPAGYWKFDEGYGATAGNSGWGTGADGTIVDATWENEGRFGKALSFDGSSSVTATIPSVGDENTISLWINPETSIASKTLVTSGKLTTNASGQPVYGDCVGTAITLGTWTHVLAVSDGTEYCAIYQNGVQTVTGTTGVSFGTSVDIGGSSFTGNIDEVQIFAHDLSVSEIKVLYNRSAAMQVGKDLWNMADAEYYGDPPVAHWKFDENSGTTAYDSSENSNDGVLGGGTAGYRPAWTGLGKFGGALEFDGEDDYVDTISRTGLNITSFTVSTWINLTNVTTADQFVLWNAGTAIPWGGWGVVINRNGLFGCDVGDVCLWVSENSTERYDYVEIAHTFTENARWYHLTIEWNNPTKTAHFYIDGALLGTGTSSYGISYASIPTTRFGKLASSSHFNGALDDIRIYNYARTPRQILQDMNGGTSGPHPIAKWTFDEGTGQPISSSHGKKVRITNSDLDGILGNSAGDSTFDPAWVTDSDDCKQGACLEFDSTSTEYADAGDTNLNINSACIWINPSTTTQPIMSFDAASTYLSAASGTVSATGFTDATIYVNGKVGTAISSGWNHVCVTSGTAVDANAVKFGVANGAYLTGKLDIAEFFNFVLTPNEVASLNNLGAVSFK